MTHIGSNIKYKLTPSSGQKREPFESECFQKMVENIEKSQPILRRRIQPSEFGPWTVDNRIEFDNLLLRPTKTTTTKTTTTKTKTKTTKTKTTTASNPKTSKVRHKIDPDNKSCFKFENVKRHSWHYSQTSVKSSTENRFQKHSAPNIKRDQNLSKHHEKTIALSRRSFSADCRNMRNPNVSGPRPGTSNPPCSTPISQSGSTSSNSCFQNLEIVGVKNGHLKSCSTSRTSSRVSTPDQLDKNLQIHKTSNVRKDRSRQILTELQQQLCSEGSDSTDVRLDKFPRNRYIVFPQKKMRQIQNLVLELENNMSTKYNSVDSLIHLQNQIPTEKTEKTEKNCPRSNLQSKKFCSSVNTISSLESIQVSRDQFKVTNLEEIGSGTFSTVYKGKLFGMDVAVKAFKENGNSKKTLYERYEKEGSLLLSLRHPHIVQILAACCENEHSKENPPLLIFENMESGSLSHYIYNVTQCPVDHATFFSISRDITLALNYLHQMNQPIIHMDVKSANVLLDAFLRAKLGDFGLAQVCKNERQLTRKSQDNCTEGHNVGIEMSTVKGTPAWMSPEVLSGRTVTTTTDVYGLGMIFCEMLSAEKPFEGKDVAQVCECIKMGERPKIPSYLNQTESQQNLRELIERCWHQDPNSRPKCHQILDNLHQLSFPDNWKKLLTELSSGDRKTWNRSSSSGIDPDEDDHPRVPPSSLVTSFVLTPSTPTTTTAPPPPPTIAISIQPTKIPAPVLRKINPKLVSSQRRKFSISCDELCTQRHLLKHFDKSHLIEGKATKDDLASVIQRVIEKRRFETGWSFNDETTSNSSECQSRSSSRISTNLIHY